MVSHTPMSSPPRRITQDGTRRRNTLLRYCGLLRDDEMACNVTFDFAGAVRRLIVRDVLQQMARDDKFRRKIVQREDAHAIYAARIP